MYFSLELSVKRSFTSIHPNPFWNDLQQWSKYGKETIAWMFLRSINNNYPTIIYEYLTAFNKHHWSDTLSLSVCQCQHQLPPPSLSLSRSFLLFILLCGVTITFKNRVKTAYWNYWKWLFRCQYYVFDNKF